MPPRCGPPWGVLLVHIGRFQQCPAGRGLPATHGTWSSQSAKQPSPRCSRNDPRTLLIALPQHGLRQPSCLANVLPGSKTAPAACHVAAPRLTPRCQRCWCWTRPSFCRTYRSAHCTFNCSCCACLLGLAVCRVVGLTCDYSLLCSAIFGCTKRLEFEFRVVDQFLNSAVFLTTTHCVLLLAD